MYQELQDLKTSLGRLEHAVSSQNNRFESAFAQQSNAIKECMTTFLKSPILKDLMRTVIAEIMTEHLTKEVPATPAVAEAQNSDTQINSGGSSFSYNNATSAWESTYEHESANEVDSKTDLATTAVAVPSAQLEETVKKSTEDITASVTDSEQVRKLSGNFVDMTPVVKTFNPAMYKHFTPATPATESSGALNVSGITHLESVDEQSFGAEEEFH